MALDAQAVDERGGAGDASTAPPSVRPHRRRRAVLMILAAVAIVVGGGTYWWASSPSLGPGTTAGPGAGITPMGDGIETTRWWQSGRTAWIEWNLTNTGPVALTFTSAPDPTLASEGIASRVGFAPGFFWEGKPDASMMRLQAMPSDVVPSITVPAGDEVSIVVSIGPARCYGGVPATEARANDVNFVRLTDVSADVTALGRTTRVELPTPQEWDLPWRAGCFTAPTG